MGIKDTNSTALSWSCWGMRPGLLLHMSDDHSQRQHYPTVYIVYIYHKLTYDLIFWLSIILMLLHRYYTTMYYIFWLLSRQLKLFSNCTSIIPAECTFLGGFTTILLTVEQWTQLGNCDREEHLFFSWTKDRITSRTIVWTCYINPEWLWTAELRGWVGGCSWNTEPVLAIAHTNEVRMFLWWNKSENS